MQKYNDVPVKNCPWCGHTLMPNDQTAVCRTCSDHGCRFCMFTKPDIKSPYYIYSAISAVYFYHVNEELMGEKDYITSIVVDAYAPSNFGSQGNY